MYLKVIDACVRVVACQHIDHYLTSQGIQTLQLPHNFPVWIEKELPLACLCRRRKPGQAHPRRKETGELLLGVCHEVVLTEDAGRRNRCHRQLQESMSPGPSTLKSVTSPCYMAAEEI